MRDFRKAACLLNLVADCTKHYTGLTGYLSGTYLLLGQQDIHSLLYLYFYRINADVPERLIGKAN